MTQSAGRKAELIETSRELVYAVVLDGKEIGWVEKKAPIENAEVKPSGAGSE